MALISDHAGEQGIFLRLLLDVKRRDERENK